MLVCDGLFYCVAKRGVRSMVMYDYLTSCVLLRNFNEGYWSVRSGPDKSAAFAFGRDWSINKLDSKVCRRADASAQPRNGLRHRAEYHHAV